MTFKEKLAIEHPDKLDSNCAGGCWGCPSDYGYDERMPCHCTKMLCDECWEREIPGTEPTKITKDKKEKKEMEPRNFSSMATMAEAPRKPSICQNMQDLRKLLAEIHSKTEGIAYLLFAEEEQNSSSSCAPTPSCLADDVYMTKEIAMAVMDKLVMIQEKL